MRSKLKSRFGHWLMPVEIKTADYTITPADFGKTFTNRGDGGAIVFTLPAVTTAFSGCWVRFFIVADQDFTIASTADEMIAFNDVDANAIAFTTNSEQVGSSVLMLCDGTSWLAIVNLGAETATPTVTT